MTKTSREYWCKAARAIRRACRVLKLAARDEAGVTAIEYSLLAALIVIVASAAIAAVGGGVLGMWTQVSDAVVKAM